MDRRRSGEKRAGRAPCQKRTARNVEYTMDRSLFENLPQQPLRDFGDVKSPAAVQHSGTSCAAADAIAPVVRSIRAAVREALLRAGRHGRTDAELEADLRIPGNSIRPQRCRLVELGKAVDSGRTRPTPAGRRATVWVAVEHAEACL